MLTKRIFATQIQCSSLTLAKLTRGLTPCKQSYNFILSTKQISKNGSQVQGNVQIILKILVLLSKLFFPLKDCFDI